MGDGRSETGRLKSFEDLKAWQMSRDVVREVYSLCREDQVLARDFGLSGQLQRAAVSIMSNIAEGFERTHIPEKIQFYSIARGSCGEVRSLLYVAEDNYPKLSGKAAIVRELVGRTGKLVSGLINATQNRRNK